MPEYNNRIQYVTESIQRVSESTGMRFVEVLELFEGYATAYLNFSGLLNFPALLQGGEEY